MTISVPPGADHAADLRRWRPRARRFGQRLDREDLDHEVERLAASARAARAGRPSGSARRESGKRARAVRTAVGEMSKATVSKPSPAAYSASSPRPHPTTRALRPATSSPRCRAHCTSSWCGSPLSHGTSASPSAAAAYRRSTRPVWHRGTRATRRPGAVPARRISPGQTCSSRMPSPLSAFSHGGAVVPRRATRYRCAPISAAIAPAAAAACGSRRSATASWRRTRPRRAGSPPRNGPTSGPCR